MIEFISGIFGSIIRMIYLLVGNNYALSIILFTILTKVVLFPLMYKQQKSMKEMQKVAPLEQEIRNKYKSSPEKMQTELMTLYSQHKVNPMGGCLPLLIQMPIIFAMFYIVKQPLTYIKQMPYEQIKPYAVEAYKDQLKAQGKNQADIDKLAAKMDKKTAKMLEIEAAKKGNLIDMNFFGVNLGDIPSKAPTKKPYLLLIPLLTLLTAMISNKRMLTKSNMTDEQKEQQKTMMLMAPIMSTYISYIMPAALGLYWLLGSVIGLLQQMYFDHKFNPTPKNELLNSGGKK